MSSNFYGFCDDPLWDKEFTVGGSWPEFSQCFQDVILPLVPCGFLLLSAPVYTWYLLPFPSLKDSHHALSKVVILKTFFLLMLTSTWVCDLTHASLEAPHFFKAQVFSPLLQIVTLILSFGLMVAERKNHFVTSGVLFVFWALETVATVIPVYTNLKLQVYESNVFLLALSLVKFICTSAEFALHFFAEKPHNISGRSSKKSCAEAVASFPSRLTFSWLTSLVLRGYRHTLTASDVPDLRVKDESAVVVPRFFTKWTKALTKARQKLKLRATQPKRAQCQQLVESSLGDQNNDPKEKYTDHFKGKSPSLVWILFKAFWTDYLLSQVWKVFYDALLLCNPLLVGLLVVFVEDLTIQQWKGYLLSWTIFLSSVLQSVILQQVLHLSTSLGLRLRAALVLAIYRKALTIDKASDTESTVGEVVNLISVDADHIALSMEHFWALWSSPLQIVVSLYVLYSKVGLAMFAGAGFLVLLIPLNSLVVSRLGHVQSQVLTWKDERMKITNELLSGMKIIKLYAWEQSFEKRILALRDKELNLLRKTVLHQAFVNFTWTAGPFMVSLLIYATFVFTSENHYLDPETAFVAMSLMDVMRNAINFMPIAITDAMKAIVSLRRISYFLCQDDLDEDYATKSSNVALPIAIVNGTFSWSENSEPALKSINISIKCDSLVAVVGAVGSGKSSLLSAILGDIKKLAGDVFICGRMAYVSQQAWIQNDSVRNNILFGKPYNETLYNLCLEACALQPDLDVLPAGDMTEIGERGINLSGGQKQRVSLARAAYAQADLYLLDDPLSSVDSHVGKHIFQRLISDSGMLAGKVRVLVTHGIQWLPHTDHIIVMTNGQISESGPYGQLLSHEGAFSNFLSSYLLLEDEEEDMSADEQYQEMKQKILDRVSRTSEDAQDSQELKPVFEDVKLANLESFNKTFGDGMKDKHGKEKMQVTQVTDFNMTENSSNLIEEETVHIGSVTWPVFKYFAKSAGYVFVVLLVFFYSFYICADMASLIWLSEWTDDVDLANFTKLPVDSQGRMRENVFYVFIYSTFGVVQVLAVSVFTVLELLRVIHASRILHANMLSRIIHAPMIFFDTTPLGRIMNRFSKDIVELEEEFPFNFLLWLDGVLMVVTSLVVISVQIPIFAAFVVPVAIIYFLIQRFFIATKRQLKRLESKTKSPIFSHFSETLSGTSVIRAFGLQADFIKESEARVDAYQVYAFSNFCSNRWLGLRLDFLGSVTVLVSSSLAVSTRNTISGGIMGLIMIYALSITEFLNFIVMTSSDIESQIVCVERIKEYTEIANEASWEITGNRPPSVWPDRGHIQLERLSFRYREGLDLVLKNLTVEIKPTEKVGIVGRTGAGKSTVTLALFRLVEPSGGKIFIDGIDISSIGLHDLRSKLTILPQDPVIFTGSLRQNLDPFGEHDDERLWTALQHAHLKDFVESLPHRLDHECEEGGLNLSVGQKQLLCLGRALLRKTKILILDEATAAVDLETDDLIQLTIREEFKECTVLTIAHRLNTVIDYDRILVLNNGEVDDFDSPVNLMKKPKGLFYSMAQSAGIVS